MKLPLDAHAIYGGLLDYMTLSHPSRPRQPSPRLMRRPYTARGNKEVPVLARSSDDAITWSNEPLSTTYQFANCPFYDRSLNRAASRSLTHSLCAGISVQLIQFVLLSVHHSSLRLTGYKSDCLCLHPIYYLLNESEFRSFRPSNKPVAYSLASNACQLHLVLVSQSTNEIITGRVFTSKLGEMLTRLPRI